MATEVEKNTFKRALNIIGVILLITAISYIVWSFMRSDNEEENKSKVKLAEYAGFKKQDKNDKSPYYNKLISENNKRMGVDGSGKVNKEEYEMYLPTLNKEKEMVKKSKEITKQKKEEVEKVVNKTPAQNINSISLKQRQKIALAKYWATDNDKHEKINVSNDYVVKTEALAKKEREYENAFTTNNEPMFTLVNAFETLSANLNTYLDTDTNSMISATITEGKLKGSVLYATNGYTRVGKGIDITFDYLAVGNKVYSVNVKPVESETNQTVLSGKVSHHYFERLVVPAIADSIAGISQLYLDSRKRTSRTGGYYGRDEDIYYDKPTNKTITAAAGVAIGNNISNEIKQQMADKSITRVEKDINSDIGVIFISSVTNKNLVDSSTLSTSAKATNSKY